MNYAFAQLLWAAVETLTALAADPPLVTAAALAALQWIRRLTHT